MADLRKRFCPQEKQKGKLSSEPKPPAQEKIDPPVEATAPEIVSKCLLTHLRPWCDRCGGWQGIETAWDDGRVDLQCRTCKASLPDQPSLEWEPKESHKLTVAAT